MSTAPVAIGYSRVSTHEQARSGLGIDAQRAAIDGWAAMRTDGRTVEHHDENGESGTVPPAKRAVLGPLLARLADPADPADTLVVAKLDRLGRSVVDVLTLIEQADAEGWHVVMLDFGLDTHTAVGKLMLGQLALMAQFERDMTSERTRDALAAKAAAGARLGRPVADSVRAAGRRIIELRHAGTTWRAIPDVLTAEGFETAQGGAWSVTQAQRAKRSVELDDEAAERRAVSA